MQYLELRPTTGQKSSHFLLETRIVVSCHKLIMEREQVPLFVAVPSFEITVEPAATFCLCAGWYSNPFTEDHANPPHGLLDQSACKKWQQAIRKHLCCWSDEGAYCAAVHIRSTSNVASCNKVSVSTSSVHKPYFEFASWVCGGTNHSPSFTLVAHSSSTKAHLFKLTNTWSELPQQLIKRLHHLPHIFIIYNK